MTNVINLQFDCLSIHNSQQMFKISSICFNARMDMSDHGLSHPFKDMTIANGFADIYDALAKMSLYLQFQLRKLGFSSVPTAKNLMNLNQVNV